MKKKETFRTIILLLIGIFIGFAIVLFIGAIGSYVYPVTTLTWPKKFGDIIIWAKKPPNVEGTADPNVYKMLWMKKNDIPFLMITQNEAGRNTDLFIFNDKKHPVFSLESLDTPSKWGQARYCGDNQAGKIVGDVFVDIDFDGRFDVKYVKDSDGKYASVSIFVDGSWQRVNHCNAKDMTAILGETKYTFDPNSGWRK